MSQEISHCPFKDAANIHFENWKNLVGPYAIATLDLKCTGCEVWRGATMVSDSKPPGQTGYTLSTQSCYLHK